MLAAALRQRTGMGVVEYLTPRLFVPLGIVWPTVFKKLNTPGKVITAGVGVSLTVEILQLPFFNRATDVDDLILNSTGFVIGYGIYLLVKKIGRKKDAD